MKPADHWRIAGSGLRLSCLSHSYSVPDGLFGVTASCLRDTLSLVLQYVYLVHAEYRHKEDRGVFLLSPAPWLLTPRPSAALSGDTLLGFPRAGDRLEGLNCVCGQEAPYS